MLINKMIRLAEVFLLCFTFSHTYKSVQSSALHPNLLFPMAFLPRTSAYCEQSWLKLFSSSLDSEQPRAPFWPRESYVCRSISSLTFFDTQNNDAHHSYLSES